MLEGPRLLCRAGTLLSTVVFVVDWAASPLRHTEAESAPNCPADRRVLVTPAALSVAEATSAAGSGLIPAGGVLRVSVPEAIGGKTVVGQLTVDRAVGAGFVTAFGCDDGIPTDADGNVSRSDLNFDGAVSPVASNRLIVQADDNGDVASTPASQPQ